MRVILTLSALTWLGVPSLAAQYVALKAPTAPITLAQAIELGRERAINAVLARWNQQAAETRVGQRRADLLPTINGTGRISRQTLNLAEFGLPNFTGVTPDFSLWDLRLRATQVLFDASLYTRYRAAADSAIAAGLDAQAAGELAGTVAGLAYLRALSAAETVQAREADSTIAAALLDQAQQLVNAGVSPQIDETRSSVNFAAAKTLLVVARNQRDLARLELARTLELPSADSLVLADSLGMPPVEIPRAPEEAVAFALEHRPEALAEHQRTLAIATTLRAVGYEYLPNLSLAGEVISSGQHTNTLAGTYNVGVQLSVPILDGWKRPLRHQEQEARLEAQQSREQDVVLQIEVEVRQALLDLASAQQEVAMATEHLELAEQELAQAEQRFQAGVAGSVETTNAQSSVFQARNALIQAKANYGTARLSAYRALGVLHQLQ